MSLEREIKEAFERHAASQAPRSDQWDVIEARIARAHRRRLAMVSTVAMAIVAAASIAIPRFTRIATPNFLGPGDGAPTTSPTPDPYVGWHTFINADYSVRYPPDWTQSEWEGAIEFRPEGLPSLARGDDTFAVAMSTSGILAYPCENKPQQKDEVVHCESVSPQGSHDYWETRNLRPNTTLVVHVLGSTDKLWTLHWPTGQLVVSSISDGTATPHGQIAAGVSHDMLTRMLIKFLELRVEGTAAESLLSANAKQLYDAHEGGLSLYGNDLTPPQRWTGYIVTARADADANSSEFTVEMRFGDGPGESLVETIGVGPGETWDGTAQPAVIRFAIVQSG